jgi:acyl carrier protein
MSSISEFPMNTQFPKQNIQQILRDSLEVVARETELVCPDRQDWEPLLDSLLVVRVVVRLEKALGMKIPPDKVVQKGGYMSVDDAVRGITAKVFELWTDRNLNRKTA